MALFDLFSFFTGVIAVLPSTFLSAKMAPYLRATLFPEIIWLSCGAKTAPYKGAKIWVHSQGPKWPLRKGLKWPLSKGPSQGQKFGPVLGAKMAPP